MLTVVSASAIAVGEPLWASQPVSVPRSFGADYVCCLTMTGQQPSYAS